MAELLIAACGISCRHHRADSALTPAPTYPTPTVTHSGNKKKKRRRRIEIGGGQFSRCSPVCFQRNAFRVINLCLNCVNRQVPDWPETPVSGGGGGLGFGVNIGLCFV